MLFPLMRNCLNFRHFYFSLTRQDPRFCSKLSNNCWDISLNFFGFDVICSEIQKDLNIYPRKFLELSKLCWRLSFLVVHLNYHSQKVCLCRQFFEVAKFYSYLALLRIGSSKILYCLFFIICWEFYFDIF